MRAPFASAIGVWNQAGKVLSKHDEALLAAAEAIRRVELSRSSGLGGFHLMVDARSEMRSGLLRERNIARKNHLR